MGRAPCCDKNGLKKGPWTPEEDLKLINHIQKHGPGNWRTLPRNAGLQRCGKSCRLRWTNYLRPDIKRGRFSFEEEETIIQLHSILGNKWSAIAARLPGRTDNEIKNYWNTHIRKRLLRMGIDPVTHAPRLDFLDLSSILSSSLCNPALINMSRLLGAQALLNPDLVRLATTLLSLKQENQDLFSQTLQDQNQLCSSQASPLQPNQFQIPAQQQGLSAEMEKQILMQANGEGLLNNLMTNFGSQTTTFQNNVIPSALAENDHLGSHPSYLNSSSNPTVGDLPEDSYLQGLLNNDNKNFGFDSGMSTPLSSSTPLNSSSTYVNGSSTEDERESYCSEFLKFQIPEGLDINEFM
ncbi:hypothetical protein FNV43_RR13510 [Rhamnella rubrinervis]|uniref:Transcription factor MYB102 n=1 Tax=Rhamnella rubrinervis TaxID=2594499 RepID=A0A8K0H1D5_9ROSA|nr:hypothetical protein FNV43_RR13510 [Rhamnella rubrinervis]